MPAPEDILAANKAFYKAFADRDLAAMEALWAKNHPVSCVHPGWPPLMGRDAVMASWRDVLSASEPMEIRVQDIGVQGFGDTALVLCGEILNSQAALSAANLFVREDGKWRIAFHQSGRIAIRGESEPPPPRPVLH
ncbi:MAG TPA: nuclear transport factor 2 family protein [Azospirillaceae bacterium]|nr:nuclear transport factor 2 family protein [Azospirillaceae bacterium]HRQ80724.1 nuclear transport factor 2 family protein [Azospirillaceae bacterium]